MKEIRQQYEKMWSNAAVAFESGEFKFDPLIDSSEDARRGITLLARIGGDVASEISSFQDQVRAIDPEQYYYPESDLHLTVMAVITCHEGFELGEIDPEDYISLMTESLVSSPPFRIQFKGITASPSCIMLQGFPENEQLRGLREGLRGAFEKSPVFSSIDARYRMITAHSTVVRFRQPVDHGSELLELLKRYRDVDFGVLEINELELVYNDWYQRDSTTERLQVFPL